MPRQRYESDDPDPPTRPLPWWAVLIVLVVLGLLLVLMVFGGAYLLSELMRASNVRIAP